MSKLIDNPGGDGAFNSARTTTRSGVPAVNVGGSTVNDFLEGYFFPSVPPGASLSGGGNRELGSSDAVTLSFTATKNTNPITLITITSTNGTITPSGTDSTITDGISIVPTGNTQSGSRSATAQQDVTTAFVLSVGDGSTTPTSTTTVTWLSKRYWGRYSTFTSPSDADIIALDGAGIGTGSELATSYSKTYNGIDGAGDYLMFAWPTAFGTTPTFTVNGLPNTAFTKIRSNSSFTNASGYARNYDVWISDTQQFSPITSFVVS